MGTPRRLGCILLCLLFLDAATATNGPTKTINFPPVQSPLLAARQNANCIPNTYLCSNSLGSAFSNTCCQLGFTCALDAAGNPACCPPGAVCTGTAPATAPPPTAAAVSYVPNPYFPFPYVPAAFANSAVCASAVDQCSKNYGSCVTGLQGNNAFGVTVVINGASTVAAASVANVGPTATAICSSLSAEACRRVQATPCAQYGNANIAGRARPTAACVAGLAAGVGVAVAGVW